MSRVATGWASVFGAPVGLTLQERLTGRLDLVVAGGRDSFAG